jgi:hypothetical protein
MRDSQFGQDKLSRWWNPPPTIRFTCFTAAFDISWEMAGKIVQTMPF